MSNLAYVFPGQGSQFVGMLSNLADPYPLIIDHFSLVSEKLGFDLWQLVQEGPETKLNQTEYTQVAMLTADVAIYKILKKFGLGSAKMMAGHSLGEYAALVCAEAITLEDAAYLVSKRGQLMQKTVPLGQGAMAAIVGLSDEQVELLCMQASNQNQKVTPANYNALGQVVIAGHTAAVVSAVQLAEEQGARLAKLIPVSVPCHCPLLKDAAEAFKEHLANANFKIPTTAVISNVDLSIYNSPSQIRTLLQEQLFLPVRWVETIQLMKKNGINYVVECGPGKILSGLIKRIERDLTALSVNDIPSLEQVLIQLNADEVVYF
ncbi:MAG: ACP S-malonyltransferase [Tatlockia sp.]|nr:ACP S-malonyltransferase [Tatlockia sp.]